MPQTLQDEVNVLVKKLHTIADRAKRKSTSALRRGAAPIVSAAKANAPQSNEPHHRYKDGRKVATYYPGNLRRSIRVLPLRRTKSAVLIGPKLARSSGGPAEGDFRGQKVDGWYAHFVEFGTIEQPPQPYMRPAAQQAGTQALRLAVDELKKEIDRAARAVAV